jgi:hypothetical protein
VDAQGSINFVSTGACSSYRPFPSADCVLAHGVDHDHGVVPESRARLEFPRFR